VEETWGLLDEKRQRLDEELVILVPWDALEIHQIGVHPFSSQYIVAEAEILKPLVVFKFGANLVHQGGMQLTVDQL